MTNLSLRENHYGACILAGEQLVTLDAIALREWFERQRPALARQYKLCWLELLPAATHLLPELLQLGFDYHSIDGRQLTLVLRLQPAAYLPLAATHSIGVGGAVFNQAGEILLVKEQPVGPRGGLHWKLPGGMTEPGEHLIAALEREVLEETGIQAYFTGWVALRHHHKGQFGASNLYLVGRLETFQNCLMPDPAEIAAAAWFEPQMYLQDATAHPFNQLLVRQALTAKPWSLQDIAGYDAGPSGFEIFVSAN